MKKILFKNSTVVSDLKRARIFQRKNTIILSNKTRDRNIKVLKDEKTGVIFIPKYKSNIKTHYQKKPISIFSKHSNTKLDNKIINLITLNDDLRRFNFLKKKIKNKTLLDFGCGKGGFLKLSQKITKSVTGLEINRQILRYLSKRFKIYDDINNIDEKFDIITLFHVLEHIPNQIETLQQIKKKLKKNGKLIIEVPHANDLLLNLKVFRNFTLWSEHLVLHTENSLSKFLKLAGYKINRVEYIQRYNFSNHLRWFLEGKPNGHIINQKIFEKNLIHYYDEFLIKNQLSDTILITASDKKAIF